MRSTGVAIGKNIHIYGLLNQALKMLLHAHKIQFVPMLCLFRAHEISVYTERQCNRISCIVFTVYFG